MNIFAAGGSSFTQNAFKFLIGNKNTLGSSYELVMLSAQDAISAQMERKLSSAEITACEAKQANTILKLIHKFLDKHVGRYRCLWVADTADKAVA